ncbi:putative reverse transcriptase domain-containing protein [Tanacetum coccineum]
MVTGPLKIWYDEDVHDLRSVETKFPAIVFNDELTSEKTLSCKPTVSSLNNNEIDFRISFDESDDEDYTNEFPAIVYNDALTSKSEYLTEPTLCPQHIDEFDLKDETSLFEYDEVEQNVLYITDLFPFNIIYPDNLKSDKDNDNNEIDIIQSSGDFKERLGRIYGREIHQVWVFDFGGLTELMDKGLRGRILMEHRDAQGQRDLSAYWIGISSAGDFLGTTPSYASIRDLMLRLCHRLIACSITKRSQAPKKVTVTDLFYLRGMDVGSVNIPYLLDRYLRLLASGRKRGEMISGGQFVTAAGAPEAAEDGPVVDEGAPAVPAPVQAPQPPPTAGPAQTITQRFLYRVDGGGTGVRVGRGGRGRRPREGNDERVEDFNGQGNDQGLGANEGVEGVNGNVEGANGGEQGNVLVKWQRFYSLDEVKMETYRIMSGCSIDQKVKYTAGSFVGKALTWWNSQIRTLSQEVNLETELWNHAMMGAGHAAYTDTFHELARLVPYLVTPESRKIKRYMYGLALQIRGMKVEKRGNIGEPSKDKNGRDDNKRTRTGNAFATTANPVGRENTSAWPKCTTCNSYHAPGGPCRTCFNCNCQGYLAKDYRDVPRNVNPINARNPTVRACYECGSTDHGHRNQGNQARGRAFMLGAEEAHRDPNIVTGMFTLNNHFATTLFDYGADYSFVSTTFIPLLCIEPSNLGFRYDIEIASGQLVEIDKVIMGCKLEIEGHVFGINLIPFGHGSFDVIIGMDWLSNYKDKIICHEKVVRIPLLDGKMLRVLGERPEEKARLLMRLPPLREIEFRIELIPGAVSVAKSPYRLAPSELEELSRKLKKL